ncbi:NUDIX domain-containing protein [Methylobacterium phyllostachyos]|uniref:NUDIX domain-containing protein n=1 Tax=Methylobacterium phyllostachyos TaxID=582672 RepID=A0A1H0DQM3_9HYPH|nr:NUDIX hydrolase [Methylobacterium phyllostachyos]SDN72378.1 NUDIX domain-containing protein [Methylobacterium phyllostachyos]
MSGRAWTVQGSHQVLKDRWLGLRADDCVTPSGHVVAPYYVLEAPDIALVLGIDAEDHVILVRHYRHPYGGLSLELPGGVIDATDRDVVAAARREMREETGYACADAEIVVTLNADPARYANRMHLVRARVCAAGPARPEPGEDLDVVRVPRAETLRLARSGAIVGAAHAAMILIGLSNAG